MSNEEPDPIQAAYEPPLVDDDEPIEKSEASDAQWPGLNTAGVLLLIRTGIDIVFAIVGSWLGSPVTWTGAFAIIASLGIAFGLWLRGKPFRLPTLGYLGLDVMLPIVNGLRFLEQLQVGSLVAPTLSRLFHAIPLLLLLIGRPSPRRIRSAVRLFIAFELLGNVARISQTYLLAR